MNLQRGMSLEAYKARREQFRKISCDHIFICRHLKHMLHAVLLLDAYVYSSNMRDEELARTEVELMMLLGGAVTERQIRVARKELIEAGFLVLVRRARGASSLCASILTRSLKRAEVTSPTGLLIQSSGQEHRGRVDVTPRGSRIPSNLKESRNRLKLSQFSRPF